MFKNRVKQQLIVFGLFIGGGLALSQVIAAAQQGLPAAPAATPVPANQAPEAEAPQSLHLLVGRSLVITSPARIKRISLADPNIADALAVTPNEILLTGKAPGGVSLIIWDEAEQSQSFEVSVDIDILGLSQKIHEVFPSEPVQIETSRDLVMLSGKISSAAVADKILEVAKNSSPKVTNFMEVPAAPVAPTGEVLLQVKFAEVDRSAVSQLGVNLLYPGSKNVGSVTTGQFGPPSFSGSIANTNGGAATPTFSLTDVLNVFLYRPDINLAATIRALQQNNLLQILAEPNLLTASGKEASFLAGGEFPFPVVQAGAGTAPVITIQFREFGVRLDFTPTITPDGMIHLKVKPEVSSLDFSNALSLQGFIIPALSTRRVESEMDLIDGQSFAIAGLMDNRVQEQFQKIPGIGSIPVLGKLFQSRSLTKSNDELLIVVTPTIVRPSPSYQLPLGPVFPQPFLQPVAPGKAKAPVQ
jgi:pilus assembly protein CpaC